ncbi:PatB family C-S lyase [Clostridium sp. AL.422]|uniref:MalY/PatB family protein n=1 Tax=Clostridium TaxID=1485 RepID=UPI00293DF6FE|nr:MULTISPECIES: PatB family C-S lyase [unclassified Clostridium]MDV4150361.1 PatB family C-S lyase [Clostridium sp. AL.422]
MKHNFDQVHNRLNTYCTQWDYIQDRFNKSNILPFSISDTDFTVPEIVYDKLKTVLDKQIYGYSRWNHHDFKGAVSNYYKRRFNTEVDEEWVIYSPSVMYSVSLLLRLLSNEGDKIASFNPMYDAFFNVIEQNNRELVRVPLHEKDGSFYIDYEEFEDKIKTSKVLLLCSPHNPTGIVWKNSELEKILELCKKYNVKIISDEIHSDIVMHGNKHIPMLNYYEKYNEIYLVSSGSKTFNYPGLICSYAIIPNEEINSLFINQTRSKDFLNSVSIMGMYATMISYNECDYYIEELVEYVGKNMDYLEHFIKENFTDIKFKKPDGTYLAWIDCRSLPFTSDEIQDALVNIGGVGIMKGEIYGSEKYLRLNCGCPLSKLQEGMKRLKKSIEYLYEKN